MRIAIGSFEMDSFGGSCGRIGWAHEPWPFAGQLSQRVRLSTVQTDVGTYRLLEVWAFGRRWLLERLAHA